MHSFPCQAQRYTPKACPDVDMHVGGEGKKSINNETGTIDCALESKPLALVVAMRYETRKYAQIAIELRKNYTYIPITFDAQTLSIQHSMFGKYSPCTLSLSLEFP